MRWNFTQVWHTESFTIWWPWCWFWTRNYILDKELYSGQGFIFWTRNYILDKELYSGQGIIFWTRNYILDKELYSGQGIIFWTRNYILDKELYSGQGIIFWTRNYILDKELYSGHEACHLTKQVVGEFGCHGSVVAFHGEELGALGTVLFGCSHGRYPWWEVKSPQVADLNKLNWN